MFLSDRPQSGMVLGTVEGNLSWRRTAAPAFADQIRPVLIETISKAKALDPSVTVVEGAFALEPEEGTGQFDGCVLMADGRVFFVPGEIGGGSAIVRPHIWDPVTGSIHEVAWDSPEPDEYRGGVLLRDGRVFFMPHPWTMSGQARIYDPSLDRVIPAGQPISTGCCGCVLLSDGRVLMVPYDNPSPLIYDPESDTVTASQVQVPSEVASGSAFYGGVLLPDERVLFVPYEATAALVYDPKTDSAITVAGPFNGSAYAGGILLPDGRVFLVRYMATDTCLFDPASDSCTVLPVGTLGLNWRGGVLLADGRVLLLPYNCEMADACVWDGETNTYAPVAELLAMPRIGELGYAGGVGLPDGQVVFCPRRARDLVVWDPGCGGGFGRDVALSGFWNKL